MPRFSLASKAKLATCAENLRLIAERAIQVTDFTVLEGHRSKAAQDEAFRTGKSKVQWPHGRHNSLPSEAMDLAPFPVDFSNKPLAIARFYLLAGTILAAAHELGIPIRWGGDWDGDLDLSDQKFNDLGHFELR